MNRYEFKQIQDYDCWITGPLVSMRRNFGEEYFDKFYNSYEHQVKGIGFTTVNLRHELPADNSFTAVSRAVRTILTSKSYQDRHSLLSQDDEQRVQMQKESLPCISPGYPKTIFGLFGATIEQKQSIVENTQTVLCDRPMDFRRIFYNNITLREAQSILGDHDLLKVLVLEFNKSHAVAFIEFSSNYNLVYYVDPSHGTGQRCSIRDVFLICYVPKKLLNP